MSVGMMLPVGFGIEPPDLLELCVAADQRGLHAVGCGELAGPEAMSVMGAAAASTANIRLETGVVPISSRSPALLAMAACTLAALSQDRFVLGIGAGSPIVSSFHADTFERPVDRVAETLAAVKAALAGERLRDRGGFKLRGIRPRPVRVFLSAMNERMLELAAREADGVVIHFVGAEQIAELAPRLRRARADAGNTAPFEIIALVHAAANGDGDPERAYRREMAPYLAVPAYRSLAAGLSSFEEVDAAAQAWQNGGRDAAADMFPNSIAAACLAVGRDAIADRVAGLRRAGCDGVRMVPLSMAGADAAPVHSLVDCLATVIDDLNVQEVVS
jgi:alkanesulfonate monooxygenase SsuD/methylene tetrahydromethanopterin reductase-like flavin-dependent oxidoreductase (luciferase family)